MKRISLFICLLSFSGCIEKAPVENDRMLAGSSYDQGDVPFERILSASEKPEDWLTYSGNLAGHRYSGLDQVNTSNVGNLRMKWVYQMTTQAPVETSPIVVDGIMYVT